MTLIIGIGFIITTTIQQPLRKDLVLRNKAEMMILLKQMIQQPLDVGEKDLLRQQIVQVPH